MPFILALDQSTSATKALLFDAEGRALDRESRDHAQHYPQPGWVEHDAEEIWQNTLTVLRAVITRHPDQFADLAGLSITNQRETIVVFERATGRPLHPALVWQDRRGDAICAGHVAAGRESFVHARTGLKIDSYFSASKLQWLVRHRPELRAKLADGSALIGTIDTYLIHRFTQGRVFATDTTNASRTLLFDLTRLAWDDELCALWEVPRRALPEIRDSSASFGETTLDGALPRPLPIRGVIGDSQASLFAQRCFEPGSAKATFGTGTSVLLNVGATPRIAGGGVLTALAWTHAGQPTYAFEGIITCSAATLTWLRDQLGLIADVRETEALARAVPDNGGVYLVPAFSGLGAPHWSESARAALVGLSAHSDRRHVVRAAVESIAYQLRDVLDAMRRESGVPLRGVHGDGGATTNAFLMQFVADLAGTDLRVAANPHFSALGAAMMGMLGLGLVPSVSVLANLPRAETVFRPGMSREMCEQYHAGWRRAVAQVLCGATQKLP
ncbi:MAG: glycerol kinase GlpK [Verrucomicrobia bacterium]|nr:glycerol kinase GlpK [Verrucomicrobiota bacterium]